jgi:hypothetical protein
MKLSESNESQYQPLPQIPVSRLSKLIAVLQKQIEDFEKTFGSVLIVENCGKKNKTQKEAFLRMNERGQISVRFLGENSSGLLVQPGMNAVNNSGERQVLFNEKQREILMGINGLEDINFPVEILAKSEEVRDLINKLIGQ